MTSVLTNKVTRWLAVLVASALVLAFMVGGDQRSAQAIGPGETDIAYVADGYNFPDALMGATLAALNTAPMLGVRGPASGDIVPPDTADELDRLTNDKANPLATIYVFGGPAAVSDKVVSELGAWANDVQRIFGDNRFGTMEAISQMLPTKVKDSDLLDGMDSTDFLGATDKAADSDLLDGQDSSVFAERLFAVVNEDGTVREHRGLASTTGIRLQEGWYRLEFDRDVTSCAVVASEGPRNNGFSSNHIISTGKAVGISGAEGNVNIRIQVFSGGSFSDQDESFDVQVLC